MESEMKQQGVPKIYIFFPIAVILTMVIFLASQGLKDFSPSSSSTTTYSGASAPEVVSGESAPVAGEALPPLVDWENFVGGPLFTVKHEESAWVVEKLTSMMEKGQLRTNNKQGCETGAISNGTVCIFAGMNPPATGGLFEGHVAILLGQPTNVGPKLVFAVVNGQMRSFEGTAPPPGSNKWVRMGDTPYFLDRSTIYWKAAWFLAERSNGKATRPDLWFNAGEGWQKWLIIKQRYNLVIPLLNVPLPGPIQRINNWILSQVRPQ